jgi:uncharacterized membrane protein
MVVAIMALLGAVIGGVVLDEFGGAVIGLFVGGLAGAVANLASKVRSLERRLDAQKAADGRVGERERPAAARSRAAEAPPRSVTPPAAPEAAAATAEPQGLDLKPILASTPEPRAPERPEPRPVRAAAAATARAQGAAAGRHFPPSAFDALLAKAWSWITTGNVPVKVGVIVSLFGVGFLVKEGIDRRLLVLPLEVRLMLVALFGIVLLVLGWHLRARQRTYALSLQGGGIGVLYLTIFASFAQFDLLPAGLAFALLIGVTIGAGVLAVLQDARALAVLGVLGGFLAPVLVSTGSGNHVALFSYYALLNVAIVGIAWFKAWRVLNVLGFAFTFGIGTLWGIDGYTPDKFATTEPFLILFTLMYLVIPVLFATRSEPKLRGFVDGTLLFGTPIVAFTLQHQLVKDTDYGLAISAVALALLYVGMATFLFRSRNEKLRVLVEAQLALGVAFLTVAVPLALDARWTSAAWALEGAALIWLAFRQERNLALLAGLALQGLSAFEYVDQPPAIAEWPIVNGYCLGALLLSFAGLFSARLFDPEREGRARHPLLPDGPAKVLSILLLVWGGIWWFVGGTREVVRVVGSEYELAALLGLAAGSTLLAMLVAQRTAWPRANWLGLTLWPSAVLLAAVAPFQTPHPAGDFGWLAWPAVVAAMLWFLRERESLFPRLRGALHVVGYWLVVALAAWEAHWLIDRVGDGIWPEAAMLALGAVVVLATLRAAEIAWPFAAHARVYLQVGAAAVVAALVLAAFVLNVDSAGAALPLTYVPLVNPLELASVLVVVALLAWLRAVARHTASRGDVARAIPWIAAIAAWFLVTMTVARTVHHWTGVPFDLDSLAASTTFQSALSIVWGVAGLAAMVLGARWLKRSVWLAGAALMSVVVVKLFLVDLGNTATIARVVSFLGVGVLLLVVGYFAPVPPRAEAEPRVAL